MRKFLLILLSFFCFAAQAETGVSSNLNKSGDWLSAKVSFFSGSVGRAITTDMHYPDVILTLDYSSGPTSLWLSQNNIDAQYLPDWKKIKVEAPRDIEMRVDENTIIKARIVRSFSEPNSVQWNFTSPIQLGNLIEQMKSGNYFRIRWIYNQEEIIYVFSLKGFSLAQARAQAFVTPQGKTTPNKNSDEVIYF